MSSCIMIYFQVHDGYFVHYFAPKGLPVVPKDVIFVIDVSGSMIGTKIQQVMYFYILWFHILSILQRQSDAWH